MYSAFTAEGVSCGDCGECGTILPGVSATKELPAGVCHTDTQCGSGIDQQCDTSNTTSFCFCEGGRDTCLPTGRCRRTACAVCNDCLDAANKYIDTAKFISTPAGVANVFEQWCDTQDWAEATQCNAIKADITTQGINVAKRAGLICQRLGQCVAYNLPATCRLTSRKVAVTGRVMLSVKGGSLVSARSFYDGPLG